MDFIIIIIICFEAKHYVDFNLKFQCLDDEREIARIANLCV